MSPTSFDLHPNTSAEDPERPMEGPLPDAEMMQQEPITAGVISLEDARRLGGIENDELLDPDTIPDERTRDLYTRLGSGENRYVLVEPGTDGDGNEIPPRYLGLELSDYGTFVRPETSAKRGLPDATEAYAAWQQEHAGTEDAEPGHPAADHENAERTEDEGPLEIPFDAAEIREDPDTITDLKTLGFLADRSKVLRAFHEARDSDDAEQIVSDLSEVDLRAQHSVFGPEQGAEFSREARKTAAAEIEENLEAISQISTKLTYELETEAETFTWVSANVSRIKDVALELKTLFASGRNVTAANYAQFMEVTEFVSTYRTAHYETEVQEAQRQFRFGQLTSGAIEFNEAAAGSFDRFEKGVNERIVNPDKSQYEADVARITERGGTGSISEHTESCDMEVQKEKALVRGVAELVSDVAQKALTARMNFSDLSNAVGNLPASAVLSMNIDDLDITFRHALTYENEGRLANPRAAFLMMEQLETTLGSISTALRGRDEALETVQTDVQRIQAALRELQDADLFMVTEREKHDEYIKLREEIR